MWQNPKPVAGVFVLDGEKVLLIKRGIKPHKGKWSIPAGYLERDESPDMAAVRELEEETGLRAPVEDIFFVDHVVFEHPDGQHLLASVYGAELENTSGEVIAGDDAAEARFWTLDNLAEDRDKLEYNEYVRLIEKSQEILGQR